MKLKKIKKPLFEPFPYPNKKYKIIYADPPWAYKDKALTGNRGAGCKYKIIKQKDLYSLPVSSIADKDCILFLWVTMPKLNECFYLIKAWGFEYKPLAFAKDKKDDSWFWGMGMWTRLNAKLNLLEKKGIEKYLYSVVYSIASSRTTKYSEKPNEVRERIVDLCGDLPRIELFAKERVKGWDCYGLGVDNDM